MDEGRTTRADTNPPVSDDETRLLPAEYNEAGAQCRNHDLLTRTNNLVFMAFFVGVTGLMENNDNTIVDTIVFGCLGIAGSLLFLYVNLLTRAQHAVYMSRAQEIEETLGFDLLRRGERLLRVPHPRARDTIDQQDRLFAHPDRRPRLFRDQGRGPSRLRRPKWKPGMKGSAIAPPGGCASVPALGASCRRQGREA